MFKVNLEQLKIPFIIYFGLIGFACIVFIIEMIVYNVKKLLLYNRSNGNDDINRR